ncbi:MAG: hypothetical protein IKT80_07515 [Bacteroidaceae bacterium]|nr:hypothetical protein [Bacteroidaceae bacterium]
MNNDIFDFKRFGNYFVTDIKNAIANYRWSMIILILGGLISYIVVGLVNTIYNYSWQDMLNGVDIEWVHANAGSRVSMMVTAFTIIIFTAPAKCYGGLTDKNTGSDFILLPASRLEKFISMILICCIVIPIVFIAGHLMVDYLICLVCPETGNCIITEISSKAELIFEGADVPIEIIDRINWTSAIDDTWMIFLFFLLGALVFKKSKAIKTFLGGVAIITVISFLLTILLAPTIKEIDSLFYSYTAGMSRAEIKALLLGWFNKMMLFDTIFDITINALLLTGIWFKLKTLKH